MRVPFRRAYHDRRLNYCGGSEFKRPPLIARVITTLDDDPFERGRASYLAAAAAAAAYRANFIGAYNVGIFYGPPMRCWWLQALTKNTLADIFS